MTDQIEIQEVEAVAPVTRGNPPDVWVLRAMIGEGFEGGTAPEWAGAVRRRGCTPRYSMTAYLRTLVRTGEVVVISGPIAKVYLPTGKARSRRPLRDKVEPVGMREVAKMAGVKMNTVHHWRSAGMLPEPSGYVSGVPWWPRAVMEKLFA